MFSLERKVAVITGAAGGIGSATARRFAQAGATVVLADLADASALAKETDGPFVRTDVSDEAQVKALMEAAAALSGRIDVVINNAGAPAGGAPISDSPAEAFHRGFDTNTLGVVFGIKHAAPHMTSGGAIVNTASLAGIQGMYGSGPWRVPARWVSLPYYIAPVMWGLVLGVGVLTAIPFAGYFILLGWLASVADPYYGVGVGAAYGFARAVPVLVAGSAQVRTPEFSPDPLTLLRTRLLWQPLNGLALALFAALLVQALLVTAS